MSEEQIMTEELKAPKKRKISGKAVALLIGIVLAAALVIFGIVQVKAWKNDGGRVALRLSEQIGVAPETAQKYAHITLKNASQFACINMAASEYKYLYESDRTVQVDGVSVPEWVIYLGVDGDTVTDVQYYRYSQLQKFGNGPKTAAHIDPAWLTPGMDQAGVIATTGFAPLLTSYTNRGMQEVYKYYYKDAETGNTLSYYLYVDYVDKAVISAHEVENPFVVGALMLS